MRVTNLTLGSANQPYAAVYDDLGAGDMLEEAAEVGLFIPGCHWIGHYILHTGCRHLLF
jgi:hypothetical protein